MQNFIFFKLSTLILFLNSVYSIQLSKSSNAFEYFNLNGAVLNVSVNQWSIFCQFRVDSSTQQVHSLPYGFDTELLQLLQRQFNFSVHLVDHHGDWSHEEGGRWSGAVGDVFNNRSQLAICGFMYTERRGTVIDFSSFIFESEITFISQTPKAVAKEWAIISSLLPYIVATVGLLLVLSTTLYVLYRILAAAKVLLLPAIASGCSFADIFLDLYGILLKQSIGVWRLVDSSPLRLIYLVWIYLVLVISTLFGSTLFAVVTVPPSRRPLDSVDDLLNALRRGSHSLWFVKDFPVVEWFVNSRPEDSVYYEIGQRINNSSSSQNNTIADLSLQIPTVERGEEKVVVSMRLSLEVDQRHYARKELHIASASFGVNRFAFVLQRHSPLKKPFNWLICLLKETGITNYLLENAMSHLVARQSGNQMESTTASKSRRFEHHQQQVNQYKRLSQDDLFFTFIVLATGLFAACAAFLAELLVHNY